MPTKSRVIYARVPAGLHDRVQTIAAAHGLPIAQVVTLALRDFCDRVGPADRISLSVTRPEGTA